MKRETKYLVTVVVESKEQDSYADPYGRTRYDREGSAFDKKADALALFETVRETRMLGGRRVVRAWVERKTTTLVGKFD